MSKQVIYSVYLPLNTRNVGKKKRCIYKQIKLTNSFILQLKPLTFNSNALVVFTLAIYNGFMDRFYPVMEELLACQVLAIEAVHQ